MSIFACFLTDNFHTIIYSICLNFISNNTLMEKKEENKNKKNNNKIKKNRPPAHSCIATIRLLQVYCILYRKATATFYHANEDCYKVAAK